MMKRKIFLLISASITYVAAVNAQEHLEPAPSYFNDNKNASFYYELQSILIDENDYKNHHGFRFLVKPAFWQPYSLVLREMNRESCLILTRATGFIWKHEWSEDRKNYEENRSEIGRDVTRSYVKVSKELVESLSILYRVAILDSRFPVDDGKWIMDGTTYYFTINEKGNITGKISSPDVGTPTGELVDISESLVKLVQNANADIQNPGEIDGETEEKLLERIKKAQELFPSIPLSKWWQPYYYNH